MQGAAEDLRGWRVLDDAPQVHHRDVIAGMTRYDQIVGDEQHGQAEILLECPQELDHTLPHCHIEGGGRLVGDQHPWSAAHGQRDRDPLRDPSRKLVGIVTKALPRMLQPDTFEQLERRPLGLGPRHAPV